MEKPTTTEPDAKQQNEQMQTQIEREKPIDPIECCATAAAWFTGDFALLCEKSPSMRQQKELLQEGSLIQGPGFLRDFLWTAAALLPLSPSTACCGDFSSSSNDQFSAAGCGDQSGSRAAAVQGTRGCTGESPFRLKGPTKKTLLTFRIHRFAHAAVAGLSYGGRPVGQITSTRFE